MQIVYDASQVDAMPHTDCLDGRHIYPRQIRYYAARPARLSLYDAADI
jgi:hypothetical protein